MYIQIYIEEPWLTSDSLTSDRFRSESRFNSPSNYLCMMTRYTLDSPLWVNLYQVFFSVWLQLRNSSQGCRWFFKKKLFRLWNSILPEPGQPSAQLSKLICPTECRKTQHSMSRWHRAVHIPWLVDSYDTHKGKHWLNSNPQPTGCEFDNPQTSAVHLISVALTLCLDTRSATRCRAFDKLGSNAVSWHTKRRPVPCIWFLCFSHFIWAKKFSHTNKLLNISPTIKLIYDWEVGILFSLITKIKSVKAFYV